MVMNLPFPKEFESANIESCSNPLVDLCDSCYKGLSKPGPPVRLDASAQPPGPDPHSDCWLELYSKNAPKFSIARGLDVGDCSGYGAAVDFDFSLVEIVMLAPVRVHLTLKKVRHLVSVCARSVAVCLSRSFCPSASFRLARACGLS